MDGKEFKKYGNRGAYHWEALARSVKKHNPYLSARYDIVLELLDKAGLSGRRVLDIGCGDAALSYLMVKAGWQVSGLDYSGTGLGLARQKFGENKARASFLRGDSCIIPVKDNSLDAVVAADIIEHLAEPERMLEEIRRVLKKGGAAGITTPVKIAEIPGDPEHVKEFTETEYRAILEKHFGKVEIKLSHPRAFVEKYKKVYRFMGVLGRMRPYKYWYNTASAYLNRNPFHMPAGKSFYTQMSALARKS